MIELNGVLNPKAPSNIYKLFLKTEFNIEFILNNRHLRILYGC